MHETRRALLDALADGPVPGPELADRLGVSPAAVRTQLAALRGEGIGVERSPDGFAVTSVPEYGAAAIEFGLETPFAVEYHDAVESTNDRASALAAEGASDVAVVAGEQTGGRGRLSRSWASPPGGVWLSVVLRPDVPTAQAPVFTLAAAVAVARAAREAGVDAAIKWPNDVVVSGVDGDAKLAGVLTEFAGKGGRGSWLVVGVGVNANVDVDALPPGATSVRNEVGDVDRRRFVQRVLEEFDDLRRDPHAVLEAWRDLAATLGRRVRVETPGGTVEGDAVGVTFPGSLVVATDEGEVTVHAGDCEHLRSP